jgi:hypothetical protein
LLVLGKLHVHNCSGAGLQENERKRDDRLVVALDAVFPLLGVPTYQAAQKLVLRCQRLHDTIIRLTSLCVVLCNIAHDEHDACRRLAFHARTLVGLQSDMQQGVYTANAAASACKPSQGAGSNRAVHVWP